jgi:hypothetical protein
MKSEGSENVQMRENCRSRSYGVVVTLRSIRVSVCEGSEGWGSGATVVAPLRCFSVMCLGFRVFQTLNYEPYM